MPRPLCRRRKGPGTHFVRSRVGGPQVRPRLYGEVKHLLTLWGIKPRFLGHPSCSIVTIQIALSGFRMASNRPGIKYSVSTFMYLFVVQLELYVTSTIT